MNKEEGRDLNHVFIKVNMEVIQMDNSYFVGWGTLALINAGLAQGKNQKWVQLVSSYH